MSSNLPITLFAFVFTLGLVIIVHELGHFLVCKAVGIYVKTFSIGFGPKLLSRRFGETEYALSIVPFGGYVKMAGEGVMEEIQDTGTGQERQYPVGTVEGNREAAAGDTHIPEHRHFNRRPPWQRLAVVVAGPLANLVLAFLVYTGIILQSGLVEIPVTRVGAVAPGSPAEAAGLAVGDQILRVGGRPVALWDDVLTGLVPEGGARDARAVPVPLEVLRAGRLLTLTLTPRRDADGRYWVVGLDPWDTVVGLVQRGGPADRAGLRSGDRIEAVDDSTVTSFGAIARVINRNPGQAVRMRWERDGRSMEADVVPQRAEVEPGTAIGRIYFERLYERRRVGPGPALRIGFNATWGTIRETVLSIARLPHLGLEAVGGPIRIGQVAGEMLRWSWGHLMQFIAFFSVNLFLLNLLPIPVLDGGHVLFIVYEMVTRRRVHERVQAIATQVGLILLLLFMTFVIVVDVLKVTGR
ncbi:MAG: RIP metalloprotease RseP [Candidatus Krumholzibacteriia bacterium]